MTDFKEEIIKDYPNARCLLSASGGYSIFLSPEDKAFISGVRYEWAAWEIAYCELRKSRLKIL